MRIRIKTYNVELPSYLMVGRVYNVFPVIDYHSAIDDDEGFLRYIKLNGCKHLNGGSWEVVNDWI